MNNECNECNECGNLLPCPSLFCLCRAAASAVCLSTHKILRFVTALAVAQTPCSVRCRYDRVHSWHLLLWSVEVVRPAIKSNRNHHSYDTSCTSMEPSTVQNNIHLSTSDFGELEFPEDDVTSQPAITCVETHIISTVFGTAGTSLRLRTQSRPHTMYV